MLGSENETMFCDTYLASRVASIFPRQVGREERGKRKEKRGKRKKELKKF